MSEYDLQLAEAWCEHLNEYPEDETQEYSFEFGFNAGWNRALVL